MTTITDVARRAGVAPVTVSRVLNAAPNVNIETRERVQQAIGELGYVPSRAARSLRSKRTHTFAFIVPDIANAFWTTVARGVEDAALAHGYSVLLCNTDEDLTKQSRYLDIMVSQRVDGVIIAPCDTNGGNLRALRDHHIATVIMDRRITGWDVDTVYCDSVSGAYALTQHLIGLGHTRIAMLSGPEGVATAEDRVTGYRLALTKSGIGIDPRLLRHGRFSWQSGAELTGQILDEGLAPTAIFAANNALSQGAVAAVGQRGLRIPSDIALACFDDYPYIASIFPFLTVVSQPAYDMGTKAAELLVSRLQAPASLRPRCEVLPVQLIIRHSCGRAVSTGKACPFNLPLEGLAEPQVEPVWPVTWLPESAPMAPMLLAGRMTEQII